MGEGSERPYDTVTESQNFQTDRGPRHFATANFSSRILERVDRIFRRRRVLCSTKRSRAGRGTGERDASVETGKKRDDTWRATGGGGGRRRVVTPRNTIIRIMGRQLARRRA